jgi:hypothetical protein
VSRTAVTSRSVPAPHRRGSSLHDAIRAGRWHRQRR